MQGDPVVTRPTASVVLVLVRGDHRLHELKLTKALRQTHPARDRRRRSRPAFGAEPGSIGPVGVAGPCGGIIADEALRRGRVRRSGANRTGYHLPGVEPAATSGRSSPTSARSRRGNLPFTAAAAAIEPAIEIGNIFKLGTQYSAALGATYLDEDGKEQPIVMGSYGIGPARILAAAVEQFADEHGMHLARVDRALTTSGSSPSARMRSRPRSASRESSSGWASPSSSTTGRCHRACGSPTRI